MILENIVYTFTNIAHPKGVDVYVINANKKSRRACITKYLKNKMNSFYVDFSELSPKK